MKSLVLLASFVAIAVAQRGSYAGSRPIGYPGLASRFQTDEGSSTTQTPISNRNEIPTQKIPVDARGDEDLVNRLNQWPREHRPFWLINSEQIEAQRNPQGNVGAKQQQQQQQKLGNRFGPSLYDDSYGSVYAPDYYYRAYNPYDDFGYPLQGRPLKAQRSFAEIVGY